MDDFPEDGRGLPFPAEHGSAAGRLAQEDGAFHRAAGARPQGQEVDVLGVMLQEEGEDVGESECVVSHAVHVLGYCGSRNRTIVQVMTRLGDYIRERRGDLDMTRADLARELQVHKAQIQRWEDGTWRPRVDRLPALARVLLVDKWELVLLLAEDVEGVE